MSRLAFRQLRLLVLALFLASCSSGLDAPMPGANTETLRTSDTLLNTQAATTGTATVAVVHSSDDAEQNNATNAITLTNSSLILGEQSGVARTTGIRFQNVAIPKGATITSAYLEVKGASSHSVSTTFTIAGEKVASPTTYSTSVNLATGRPKTTATSVWRPNAWVTGGTYRSGSLVSVIQEIVNLSDWYQGNALALQITGTGTRQAHAFDGGAANAPKLVVTYSYDSATSPTFLSKSVAAAGDDAEEPSGAAASISGTVLKQGQVSGVSRVVGLRFSGLTIPPGARIDSAVIELNGAVADSGATSLTVTGEASDNAAIYVNGAAIISGRAKTQATSAWSPNAWLVGGTYRTGQLKSILQEIVSRPGWSSGNAAAFTITGTGLRQAKAFEGGAATAPRLIVSYTPLATQPPANPCSTMSGTLPSPWSSGDIGTVSAAGKAIAYSNAFDVCGYGAGLDSASDAFHFVSQPLNGDGTFTARLSSLDAASASASAGIMIREGLTATSKYAALKVSGNQVSFLNRGQTVSTMGNDELFDGFFDRQSNVRKAVESNPPGFAANPFESIISASQPDFEDALQNILQPQELTPQAQQLPQPIWLRVVRRGDKVSGFTSSDGKSWILNGTATILMGDQLNVGFWAANQGGADPVRLRADNINIEPFFKEPDALSDTLPPEGQAFIEDIEALQTTQLLELSEYAISLLETRPYATISELNAEIVRVVQEATQNLNGRALPSRENLRRIQLPEFNEAEKLLIWENPFYAAIGLRAYIMAPDLAESLFEDDNPLYPGRDNAFQHALWIALFLNDIHVANWETEAFWVKAFTDAHECIWYGNPLSSCAASSPSDELNRAMDLHNNEWAFDWALETLPSLLLAERTIDRIALMLKEIMTDPERQSPSDPVIVMDYADSEIPSYAFGCKSNGGGRSLCLIPVGFSPFTQNEQDNSNDSGTLPPDEEEPNEPGEPGNAQTFGDPHMRTFDDLVLSVQSVGEFILARSLDDDFEVQARFRKINDGLSANAAIAMNVAGDKVSIYTKEEAPPSVFINGSEVDYGDEFVLALTLPNGGLVSTWGTEAMVIWPDGSLLQAELMKPKSSSLAEIVGSVKITIPAARAGRVEGILGNFDGAWSNDIKTRVGQVLTDPTMADIHTIFAESWRITQGESLFVYQPGESTATFTDRSAPSAYINVESLDPSVRSEAEQTCRNAGVVDTRILRGCTLDVAATNDPAWAAIAVGLDPNTLNIAINPLTFVMLIDETKEVGAIVSGPATNAQGITWQAEAGEVLGTGSAITYEAPSEPGEYVLTATLNEDTSVTATATVIVLQSVIAPGDVRFSLSWGAEPRDLDAHLWLPEVFACEIYYGNKGNAEAYPFATLDLDAMDGFGPEVITIQQRYNTGVYEYGVMHYAGFGDFTSPGIQVEMYTSQGRVRTFTPPASSTGPSGTGTWWHVFSIQGATGEVTEVNELVANLDPYANLENANRCNDPNGVSDQNRSTLSFDSHKKR